MRVCLVSTGHDARDDRLYFKEARSLAKEHDVTLIAPLLNEGPIPKENRLVFRPLRCKSNKFSRALMVGRLFLALPRGRYDVIHLSDNEMLLLCPILKWRCKAKIVCDIWEANYETILGPTEEPGLIRRVTALLFRSMERWVARRCDLVLTADDAIAASLGPQVKATVIFNYPLLHVLAVKPAERESLKEKYRGRRCLIYHGSMAEVRGVFAAIEAMGYVRERHPDAKLLLVGRLPESLDARVRSLIGKHGLGEAVDLVGWVDHAEVGRYLAVCEIGLVPFARTKKFEKNIPQKIFEYWAVGLAVVATDLTPIRRYMDQCHGGVLTSSNEPRILADAISYLLSTPEVSREMGNRGREAVEEHWRWEYMEAKLLEAYRGLAE